MMRSATRSCGASDDARDAKPGGTCKGEREARAFGKTENVEHSRDTFDTSSVDGFRRRHVGFTVGRQQQQVLDVRVVFDRVIERRRRCAVHLFRHQREGQRQPCSGMWLFGLAAAM